MFDKRQFEQAGAFFETYIEQHPEVAAAHFYLGRIQLEENNFKTAETELRRAIELEEQNPDYHFWLARLYLGRIPDAGLFRKLSLSKKTRKHLERAVELDSSHAAAREYLFGFYFNAPSIAGGSMEKARFQAEELVELDACRGHYALARIYQKEKKTEMAEQEYRLAETATGGRVDDPDFYNNYGYLLLKQQKVNEAIEKFQTQVELAPGRANSYDSLGDGYRAAGRLQEALIAYRKALEIDPAFKPSKKNVKELEKRLRQEH